MQDVVQDAVQDVLQDVLQEARHKGGDVEGDGVWLMDGAVLKVAQGAGVQSRREQAEALGVGRDNVAARVVKSGASCFHLSVCLSACLSHGVNDQGGHGLR